MDTSIREPNTIIINWKWLISLGGFIITLGGFIWRLLYKVLKLNQRVDKIKDKVEDLCFHSEGAESLGRHLSTLLERVAKQEAYTENIKDDVKEIKEILNKNFTWNGIEERRKS